MVQLSPFHHHLAMRLAFYIVYSLREWQVHTQECFHTLISISRIDDTIHQLLSSPSWDLQCMAQMCVPLGRWIVHFFVSFLLVVMLYYFCRALDNLVSGQNPHSIHLLWVKLLVMLAEGWTFHWNAAELLSNEFRIVRDSVGNTDWYLI